MTTPSYYAFIPAKVRHDRRLKANEKLLYAELTALTQIDGYSWATNKFFADLYGVSKVAVSRWLSNLQSCGYIRIEIDERDHSSRRIYTFLDQQDQGGINEKVNTHNEKVDTHNEKINILQEKKNKEEKKKQEKKKLEKENNINNNIYTPQHINMFPPHSQKTETRHKHGEYNNVLFTDDDYEKLKEKRPDDYQEWIDKLSAYMASTGKAYKNHYVTICNWIRREQREQEGQTELNSPSYSLDELASRGLCLPEG